MKKILFAFLLIPCVLALQGCPKAMTIIIFNHSLKSLIVSYVDGQTGWQSQTQLRLTDAELNRIEWVERPDRTGTMPVLKLIDGAIDHRYSLIAAYSLPPQFVTTGRTTEMYLQIEPDGLLYAVRPTEQWPATILTPQPRGFPVKPTTDEKAR
ncbi:MAG: hypothetical protein ACT4PZ_21875 [Panacagrimonas sp.]